MSALKKFWLYCWGIISKPTNTFKEIEKERSLLYPIAAMGIYAILYSTFAITVYIYKSTPPFPWISIPQDDYYLWESIFVFPLTIQFWVIFSGVAHLLSKLRSGKGTYEKTFAVLGFAYSVPLSIIFLVPCIVLFLILGYKMAVYVPICTSIAALWSLILSVKALKVVQKIKPASAFFIGLIAMIFGEAIQMLLLR